MVSGTGEEMEELIADAMSSPDVEEHLPAVSYVIGQHKL